MTAPTPTPPGTGGGAPLRLAEMMAALSLATDFGTGQPFERALRTCWLAMRLGQEFGCTEAELTTTYYTALLRFVGCTSDMEHLAAIFGDERGAQALVSTVELLPLPMLVVIFQHAGAGYPVPERMQMLLGGLSGGIDSTRVAAVAHCEVSQNVARRLNLGPEIDNALGQLFERWDGRGMPGRFKGDSLSTAARLVHIAQDAEVFHRLNGTETAIEMARRRAGGFYDPQMAACFEREGARLLAEMPVDAIWDSVIALEPQPHRTLTPDELDTAAAALADFTDLRSRYSHGHSRTVADLAGAAARTMGLGEAACSRVTRTALLHDIGRTSVSLRIWDKPGPLTPTEWESVRLYPYYTERILARPAPLAELGALAALHRERLDGSGYFRGLPGNMLSSEAQIVATADAYQSKREVRAYRSALEPEAAADFIWAEVRSGKLDRLIAEAVLGSKEKGVDGRGAWPADLSDREVEVLRLLAHGNSSRQIGERLFISRRTAEHHIEHIYNKIGVSTRAAAVLFAIQHQIVQPG